MMTTTRIYEFGDVVVVDFPFTNLTESKRRRSIVISPKNYNQRRVDVILMAATGSPAERFASMDIQDWRTAGFVKPSSTKPIIFSIEQVKIRAVKGRLSARDQATLRTILPQIIG